MALYRQEQFDQCSLVVTRALARFPHRSQLHAALRVTWALALQGKGDTMAAATQLEAAELLLADFPAPATRRLGPNWHERLLIEKLLSEFDRTELVQAPPSP